MSDFWTQLIEYTNIVENDTSDIDNPEHLLSKLLKHVENERDILEAQVKKKKRIFENNDIFIDDFYCFLYSSIQFQ